MKIGILTFHFVDNYGAVLQAYALKSYLISIGHDVDILNYSNPFLRSLTRSKFNKLKSKVWAVVKRMIAGTKKHKSFELFRKQRLEINNRPIHSKELFEMFIVNNSYDVIIVGSDQVWNPSITGSDETYLLSINSEKIVKISYAASFGKSLIDNTWLDKLCYQINSYKAVSVREKTAKSFLCKKNVTKNVSVVADPVFLLERAVWEKLATKRLVKEDYILCYVMPGDSIIEKRIEKAALKISEEKSLKIIYIGRKEYKRFLFDGKDMIDASPEDFLSLFQYATIVLTNSFHGTAFSIIFNKDFYSFVNNELSAEMQLGSRIIDLLYTCNLEDRTITANTFELLNNNHSFMVKKVTDYIQSSKQFLISNLNDI